jgi:outer membrane immunogenic protein
MKSLMIAASVASLLAIAAPVAANAEVTWYGNVGYASINADPVNLGAIQGRLGAQFNPYIGVEGEVAFGVQEDTIFGVDVKLSNEYGVYAVAKAPLSDQFDIFARVGYARAEIDVGGTGLSDDGVAYGVGAQYTFDGKNGVRADYTKYDFLGDADVWSVSYVRKF